MENSVQLLRELKPTFRYWMETEVHVYGLSVAASVLLSFFPFLIVMVSVCRYVLHWPGAEQAIYFALSETFPDEMGKFIIRNLQATVAARGPFQVISVLLLLFTANGIFEPLEVALNRVFRAPANRSYFRNQLVSLGLVFLCGALVLASITLTAVNRSQMEALMGAKTPAAAWMTALVFKMAALPITILMLLLIYKLLPNGRVDINRVVPAAVLVGLLLEALKYLMWLIWPWLRLKLSREYGPFINSVTILLWSFFGAMLVLAGGEWAARQEKEPISSPTPPA
jgi:membrane protein